MTFTVGMINQSFKCHFNVSFSKTLQYTLISQSKNSCQNFPLCLKSYHGLLSSVLHTVGTVSRQSHYNPWVDKVIITNSRSVLRETHQGSSHLSCWSIPSHSQSHSTASFGKVTRWDECGMCGTTSYKWSLWVHSHLKDTPLSVIYIAE